VAGDWVVIGVPSSAGAHHAGQERAPAALRAAGLIEALTAAGVPVTDAGDLPGAVFEVDPEHPRARSLAVVVRVAREVADAVAGHVAAGRRPLVIGGDCTIALGVVAGFALTAPGVGLVYVDGDTDLGTSEDSTGILDSAGVTHLLGGGAPELAGLAGPPPLLAAERLALVGGDPRETSDAGRAFLAGAGVSLTEGPAFAADPAGVARRAIERAAAAGGPVIVHFDVDTVDSADLPLANFPHYGSGVPLAAAATGLRALLAHPSAAALVLTEVNPTHDPAGRQLDRYVAAVAGAVAGAA
jgi:arginase